ncbi:hypothetical protein NECAME_07906 [Necator americanus]|uniref:Uncharacterized protein n=1 Tax=Necator americanus TaxID=51031 RepID=W2TKB3_NECAM|nr:hypothetical protein NECAME_07906 [Necator americanus]ETN82520.1 hypothetical protein NECAME_07906 [Necator americanus]
MAADQMGNGDKEESYRVMAADQMSNGDKEESYRVMAADQMSNGDKEKSYKSTNIMLRFFVCIGGSPLNGNGGDSEVVKGLPGLYPYFSKLRILHRDSFDPLLQILLEGQTLLNACTVVNLYALVNHHSVATTSSEVTGIACVSESKDIELHWMQRCNELLILYCNLEPYRMYNGKLHQRYIFRNSCISRRSIAEPRTTYLDVDTRTIVVSNPFLSREMALQDLERTMQEITSFNLCFENTLNEAVRDELQENGYNVASTTNYLIVSGWHDPIKCNVVFNLNKVKQKRRQVVPDGYTCLEQNGKIVGICAISCSRGRRCPEICSPNKVVDIPQKFRNYRLTIRFVNGMESISDEKWTEILSRVQIALKQDKNMKTFEKFSSMLEGNPFIIE